MLLRAALACDPGTGTPVYAGTKMSDYFAFDGNRSMSFNNEDVENITWKLRVDKKPQTTVVDGREVATMEYYNAATAELLGSVDWSSVTGDSVMVHGYSLGAMGAPVTFDPPIEITDGDDAMRLGDATVSESKDSNGTSVTYTSTLVESLSTCPTIPQDDFTQCVRMTIDDGDGDAQVGALFTGDVTLVAAYGPVYQTIPGWETQWELSEISYTSDEE